MSWLGAGRRHSHAELRIAVPAWLLGWLMVALVGMQTLGAMHAVAHGVPSGSSESAQLHSPLQDLFSGHGGNADCQLYDQVSHGDGLTSAVPPLVAAPVPVFLFQYFQGEAVARWATLFDARGPPSLR